MFDDGTQISPMERFSSSKTVKNIFVFTQHKHFLTLLFSLLTHPDFNIKREKSQKYGILNLKYFEQLEVYRSITNKTSVKNIIIITVTNKLTF